MNATIYISKENEDYWASLENKSAAVNEMLDLLRVAENIEVSPAAKKRGKDIAKMFKERATEELTPEKIDKVMGDNFYGADIKKEFKLCEHGAAKGFCKQSKCKFS